MPWVGRDPQLSLGIPPGIPQESHHVPESIVQGLLELCRHHHHFPGEPVPVPDHPLCEEAFPNIQPKSSLIHLQLFPQVLSLVTRDQCLSLLFPLWGSCRQWWGLTSVSSSPAWTSQVTVAAPRMADMKSLQYYASSEVFRCFFFNSKTLHGYDMFFLRLGTISVVELFIPEERQRYFFGRFLLKFIQLLHLPKAMLRFWDFV